MFYKENGAIHLKMVVVILLAIVVAYSHAAPAINYMTDCERTLHVKCVIKIGSSPEFRSKCKPEKMLSCLKDVSGKEICTEKDRESLPTIRRLIGFIKRKFENDPTFCNSDKKFNDFTAKIQDTFKVQGEGIEYTDQGNQHEYSGSGDSNVQDDTEEDAKDDDENNRSDTKPQNTDQNENSKKTIQSNVVPKGSKFWKEKSKLILKGKNDLRVQNRVFFDDQSRGKHKKTVTTSDGDVAKLQRAWDELKQRYQRWYMASKYNRRKRN